MRESASVGAAAGGAATFPVACYAMRRRVRFTGGAALAERHQSHAAAVTAPVTEPATAPERQPRAAPLYHVVLLDDDEHTYDYVIEMLVRLFRCDARAAYRMACEVDAVGRVIVDTTVLERAEFKRDQILAYGPDPRLACSTGSMKATLEYAGGA